MGWTVLGRGGQGPRKEAGSPRRKGRSRDGFREGAGWGWVRTAGLRGRDAWERRGRLVRAYGTRRAGCATDKGVAAIKVGVQEGEGQAGFEASSRERG